MALPTTTGLVPYNQILTASTIAKITITIANGIHSGAVTNHQDHDTTPISFRTRNIANNTPPNPKLDELLLELMFLSFLYLS